MKKVMRDYYKTHIITIPAFPPSLNELHGGMVRSQQFYLTKKHKEFRKVVAEAVGDRKIDYDEVSVSIILCPRDRRRRDIDNYIKAVFDSLTACGFWADDSQVKYLKVKWGDVGDPQTIVEVKPLGKFLFAED